MPTTCQIDINAPPETVFSLIADPEKHPLWLQGVESTVFDAWSNPTRPGARFTQKLRQGAKLQELQGEVLAYDRPWQYGILLRAEKFTVEVYYRLSPRDNGTRLDFSCDFQGAGRLYKFFGVLLGWFMNIAVGAQLQKLKALAEKPV